MWKSLIDHLTDTCSFHQPATAEDIARAEHSLGMALPDDLRALLSESDGIDGNYGDGLIWPIERIIQDNLEFRYLPAFKELYMPFDSLLFFADAGNGDQFAFTILDGAVRRPDIFIWEHEDDSRRWIAPSLREYLACRSGEQELL